VSGRQSRAFPEPEGLSRDSIIGLTMASLPRTYGDLGNLDARGRAVLYHADEMKREGIQLKEGLRVLVWDGDYEAEGTLEYYKGHWRARVDWETAIDKETRERLPEKYWK